MDAALDLAALLPDCYARYRPVIRDCMLFFIGRLSPQRRVAIFMEQAAMPPGTAAEERFVALLHKCPTLHKLGQVVARDRRLSHDFRTRLQELETLPPALPIESIAALVARELGDADAVELGGEAIAEASVAIAVPFTWRDGDERRDGIFKVLKPRIEELIGEELDIWEDLGSYVEERCAQYGLPELDYRDTVESVRTLLLNEVRLDIEQHNLRAAREFYADSGRVRIPRLLPWCTPRMTAMERIHGEKVTKVEHLTRPGRRMLADLIVESLLAEPFWSGEETAVFHADPHAGNLILTTDDRLAVIDWSLVTRLDKSRRVQIMQLLLAAMTFDEARLCDALAALGRRAPDMARLRPVAAEALRQVRRGRFPGFDWLVDCIDEAMMRGNLTLPEDLVLFRKAVLTVTGVLADIAETSPDSAMVNAALMAMMRDMPARALAGFESRAFESHLSNADLFGLWASWPYSAGRFWLGCMRDFFGR